jgi:hypothetical protein
MQAQSPIEDLLGASWPLGATVTALAWCGDRAGFALADGTVAIARAGWEGAAALRAREGGGVELMPADGPPPPLARAKVARGRCLAIAPTADAFLTGTADGRLRRVDRDGQAERIAKFDGSPVTSVATLGDIWACVAGGRLYRGTETADAGFADITALASHPQAGTAIGHAGGVTLLRADMAHHLSQTPAVALAFGGDGRALATGNALWRSDDGAAIALADTEAEVHAVALTPGATHIAQAGADGVRAWAIDLARAQAGPATQLSRTRATAIAFHPRRNLIAVAHANGGVTLGPPAPGATLLLRAIGAPPATALAFNADGTWLAIGSDSCALIRLPDLLFRDAAAPSRAHALQETAA